MTANIITLLRIGLVFVAVLLFGAGFYGQLAAFLLTILIIYMDALDGYVARKLNTASDFGALFDITGDRIVENVYWIYFASIGMVTIWIPIIVITRGFLTDSLRSIAFAEGKTAFGDKTMMRSVFTRFLVSSRFSRGIYGVSKAVIFCYLGGLIAVRGAVAEFSIAIPDRMLSSLGLLGQIIAYIVLIMCIIRGIPVLWDGRYYLLEKRYPKAVVKEN
ncbi:MAG: CDP-alcohol phosphatidyltransferase family protein [Candidatus Krumholzibacteria bacterium]|nr:CDP-alcohol phosphatidyltransferase family protein [Candidatus Krumholzibacteria bacterium]